MVCTPSGSAGDHLTISDVAVKPDGSFSAQTSQVGLLNGNKTKFIHTFSDHLEGPATGSKGLGIWRDVASWQAAAPAECAARGKITGRDPGNRRTWVLEGGWPNPNCGPTPVTWLELPASP